MNSVKKRLSEDMLKKVRRECNILSLTDDIELSPRLSNIVKYDSEIVERRKKILGLRIGRKYKLTNGSTDSKYFFLIKKLSDEYDVIITGSAALRIYGLLDRHVTEDIDIIATQDVIDEMSKVFNEYKFSAYENTNGFKFNKSFVIKGIKVDVFLDGGRENFRYVNGVKIHEPFSLMNYKLGLGRNKDIEDGEVFIKLLRNKII